MGSSAGGVGALSTLVSTLSNSFSAPLVFAQHLDPQRPSHLGTILERRSTLPVLIVSEHEPTKLKNGKIGAVDVKNAGGVVIIQNPQTAAYPSMPLSLPPTAVDHVVELEQIGPLLYDI